MSKWWVLPALVIVLAAGVSIADDLTPEVENRLENESYIYVATRRHSGEWSSSAPIWFCWDGKAILFMTATDSWKARRIRRNSPVRISVGTEDGPTFEASAEIVTDAETVQRMGEVYEEKYWIAWLGLFRPRVSHVTSGKTFAVRVPLR